MTPSTTVRSTVGADAVDIFALMGNVTRYWAVVAALEIGVFEALRHGAAPTVELAARCGGDEDAVNILCGVLADLGLVEQAQGTWAATAAARAHLMLDGDRPLGQLLRYGPGRAANLPALSATVRGAPPPEAVDDDDSFWSSLYTATLATQRQVASSTAAILTGGGFRSILEVGPCAGAWSIEMLARDPAARARVDCRPGVRSRVEASAAAAGVAGRLATAGDDGGGHQLVILANALRVLPAASAQELLTHAIARAAPHAAVVVADYFVDADGPAGRSARAMAVTMLANTRAGGALRGADVCTWLQAERCSGARMLQPMTGFGVVVASAPGRSPG